MMDLPLNYARVLYDMNIEPEDLTVARDLLTGSPELMEALESPLVRRDEKERVIDRLFPESVRSFVKVMTGSGAVGCAAAMFDAFDDIVRRKNETVKAVFTYVTEPDQRQIEGLKAKIARDHGKKNVELILEKDPSILGGFILTVGETVYDQSVRTSIAKMKRHFAER